MFLVRVNPALPVPPARLSKKQGEEKVTFQGLLQVVHLYICISIENMMNLMNLARHQIELVNSIPLRLMNTSDKECNSNSFGLGEDRPLER